jgi:hypothetical protein
MKPWTTKEMRFIKENYLQMSDKEMAAALDRVHGSIKAFRVRLKLRKPKGYGQFAPGNIPKNKGKSYDPGGDSLLTRFKPGHTPHNTRQDFNITTRYHRRDKKKHLYIRVAKGKWQALHRYIWEQANGPVPAKHLIMFIDGDTMNCNIENLRCITRAENVLRNTNRKKAGDSIRKHWNYSRTKEIFGLKTSRHNQLNGSKRKPKALPTLNS